MQITKKSAKKESINLAKSFSLVLYFVLAQSIATIGIVIWKLIVDSEWAGSILDIAEKGDFLSKGYGALMSEILHPTLIASDIIIIVPILISALKKNEKLAKPISSKNALCIFSLGCVLNFVVSFVVDHLPESAVSNNYNALMSTVLTGSFGITLLCSGILAPIVEELVFRYGVFRIYGKTKKAVIISSVMFGIAHLNLIQSSYAFVLGLVLGYIYLKNDNLLENILLHLTINSTSILYEYANPVARSWMLAGVVVCAGIVVREVLIWQERNISSSAC